MQKKVLLSPSCAWAVIGRDVLGNEIQLGRFVDKRAAYHCFLEHEGSRVQRVQILRPARRERGLRSECYGPRLVYEGVT
jgi:hypothetical protein